MTTQQKDASTEANGEPAKAGVDQVTASTGAPAPKTTAPLAAPPAAAQASEPANDQDTRLTQDAIDKIVKARLKSARAKWDEEQAAIVAQAAEASETAKLVEEQRWQELATRREGETAAATVTLAQANAKLETYAAALDSYLAKERDGLPEHISVLLDKMSVPDQLAYISEHGQALKPALTATEPAPKKNAPAPTPMTDIAPSGQAGQPSAVAQFMKNRGLIPDKQ